MVSHATWGGFAGRVSAVKLMRTRIQPPCSAALTQSVPVRRKIPPRISPTRNRLKPLPVRNSPSSRWVKHGNHSRHAAAQCIPLPVNLRGKREEMRDRIKSRCQQPADPAARAFRQEGEQKAPKNRLLQHRHDKGGHQRGQQAEQGAPGCEMSHNESRQKTRLEADHHPRKEPPSVRPRATCRRAIPPKRGHHRRNLNRHLKTTSAPSAEISSARLITR